MFSQLLFVIVVFVRVVLFYVCAGLGFGVYLFVLLPLPCGFVCICVLFVCLCVSVLFWVSFVPCFLRLLHLCSVMLYALCVFISLFVLFCVLFMLFVVAALLLSFDCSTCGLFACLFLYVSFGICLFRPV